MSNKILLGIRRWCSGQAKIAAVAAVIGGSHQLGSFSTAFRYLAWCDGSRGDGTGLLEVRVKATKVAYEQGAGVIVVTPDQRALDVFDRIYEMEDGGIFESSYEKHGITKTAATKSVGGIP